MPKGKWQPAEIAHRIHGLWPEQRLAGALLAAAVEDCRTGDVVACEWLNRRGVWWLDVLAGEMAETDAQPFYDALAAVGADSSTGDQQHVIAAKAPN